MTGWSEFNYLAFQTAAPRLRAAGFAVECPTAGGQVDDWVWSDYLRRGLTQMLRCDGLALLDGWQHSVGARLEVEVAERLGMFAQPVGFWIERGAAGVALLAKE